jgi:hypothetical protein
LSSAELVELNVVVVAAIPIQRLAKMTAAAGGGRQFLGVTVNWAGEYILFSSRRPYRLYLLLLSTLLDGR